MHALFALEDQYGLHAYRDESGVPQLMFKDKRHDSLNMLDHIGAWANMYQKFRNEEITEKEYLDWKAKYPQNQNYISGGREYEQSRFKYQKNSIW